MNISYIYILLCSDGSYYTGITSNLSQRLEDHNSGYFKNAYTYNRRPLELVFTAEFTDINLAIETEKQLKKWSHKKKQALIQGRFELLPELSKKIFRNKLK